MVDIFIRVLEQLLLSLILSTESNDNYLAQSLIISVKFRIYPFESTILCYSIVPIFEYTAYIVFV